MPQDQPKETTVEMIKPLVRRVLIAMVACSLVVIAGCDRGGSGSGASKVVKLAFVTNNASEFWKIAAAGVHKYEQEGKVQVDIKMPPNGTTEEQNQILENLASQGYDAIAVSVIAPNDQVPVLNKVAAEDERSSPSTPTRRRSNRLLYIGTNNYEAGKVLGGEIVKLLPNGGKMAVFVGTLSADNAAQRLKGIEDAISGHKHRDRRQARRQHRSRQGALERRRHHQRPPRPEPRRGPLVLQRSGDRRRDRGARQEGQGAGRRVRRGRRHAQRHRQRHRSTCTVVQKPFQFGYLVEQVDARPRDERRDARRPLSGQRCHRHRRRSHQQGQRGEVSSKSSPR